MIMNMYTQNRLWIHVIVGLFLVFFVSELLEKSMFIDGVWYAVIARNLAEGNGSYWFPQFSKTIFATFSFLGLSHSLSIPSSSFLDCWWPHAVPIRRPRPIRLR